MLVIEYDLEMFSPPCDPGSPIGVATLKTDAEEKLEGLRALGR